MAILTEREVRRRELPSNRTRRASDLTPAEHDNVKAALRFLARRFGTFGQLAEALTVRPSLVERAVGKRGRPSAALAIRAARVAGVMVEELLAGRWPKPGTCPVCGRG